VLLRRFFSGNVEDMTSASACHAKKAGRAKRAGFARLTVLGEKKVNVRVSIWR
jgi:hypothetical protein